MPASFQIDAGPISIEVRLDDSGIRFRRETLGREHAENIAWERITGATLVRPGPQDAGGAEEEERVAQFVGAQALAKFHELHGKVGQIFVAYRDDKNRLQQTEIPAPLADAAYLREFPARLGTRWLGETQDRQQVDKKLHTNPGFFKSAFVLIAILGMVAVIAGIGFLGLLAPAMNLLSIQKMLLDLQDGNYVSLGYRAASYVALFCLGYLLHRVIRSKLEAMKRPCPQHWRSPR